MDTYNHQRSNLSRPTPTPRRSPYSHTNDRRRSNRSTQLATDKQQPVPEERRRMNALAPAASLPVRFLNKIFLFTGYRRPTESIRLARVCHHWRTVAESTPELWIQFQGLSTRSSDSYILTKPKLMERTQNVPLDVTIESSRNYDGLTRPGLVALDYLSRIKRLAVEITDSAYCSSAKTPCEVFWEKCAWPSPKLRCLELGYKAEWQYNRDITFSLPSSAFPNARLDCLRLTRFNISPNSHLLQGLTHLEIGEVSYEARITPQKVKDVLQRMPSLQHLSLHGILAYADADSTSATDESPVQLDLLQELSIIDAYSSPIEKLISFMAFPVVTKLRIHADTANGRNGSITHSLVRRITEVSIDYGGHMICDDQHMHALAIHNEIYSNGPRLTCFYNRPHCFRDEYQDPELSLQIPSEEYCIVDSTCKLLPLANIRVAGLFIAVTRPTFSDIFGTLRYLERITVLGENLQDFVGVLSAGIGSLFSSLVEIDIHGDELWQWPEEAILEELLDSILMLRYDYGLEIRSLRLRKLTYPITFHTFKTCERLREIVVDVGYQSC